MTEQPLPEKTTEVIRIARLSKVERRAVLLMTPEQRRSALIYGAKLAQEMLTLALSQQPESA